MTDPLVTRSLWYHARTNTRYEVIGFPRTRVNGEWYDGVHYETSEGETKQFVRTKEDFLNSFSFVRFL